MRHQASAESAKSAAGLYRQDNTFCVFHHMYHPILGLSSRRVSLTRKHLTFRTCNTGLSPAVLLIIQGVIPVQEVDEVNV